MKWFRKSAAQKEGFGEYCLGLMYASGRGVLENAAEAEQCFVRASALKALKGWSEEAKIKKVHELFRDKLLVDHGFARGSEVMSLWQVTKDWHWLEHVFSAVVVPFQGFCLTCVVWVIWGVVTTNRPPAVLGHAVWVVPAALFLYMVSRPLRIRRKRENVPQKDLERFMNYSREAEDTGIPDPFFES